MKKDNTNCCVYNCKERKTITNIVHFHLFPKRNINKVTIVNKFGQEEKVDRRLAWERALLMDKKPSNYLRVCSKHFTKSDYLNSGHAWSGLVSKCPRLRPTAVPSLHLPKKPALKNIKLKIDNRRTKRPKRRQILREKCDESLTTPSTSSTTQCDNGRLKKFETNTECFVYIADKSIELSNLNENEQSAVFSLYGTKSNSFEKSVQACSGDLVTKFSDTIKTDSELKLLTNIQSFSFLNELSSLVQTFYGKKVFKINVRDKIILVFMKLKLSLSFRILSFLFKISSALCGKIFDECIQYLSNILTSCVHIPSISECWQSFADFPNVRFVIDCTEIAIHTRNCLCCSVKTNVKTSSKYKKGQTFKIMTAVTPGGLIGFVSKAFDGRTSDAHIFENSMLMQKLESRVDSVMVDKGFHIDQYCNENWIEIVRPSFVRNKKQCSQESILNSKIFKARVLVERVNQRLRKFEILNGPFSCSLARSIDDIVTVCCAMVNLQNPVMNDKFCK